MKRILHLAAYLVLSIAHTWADMPAVMLAQRYHQNIDPTEYWISEKLDGVRALWDGKQLYFRSGKPIDAPEWFLAGLPPEPLDGELWMGRSHFDRLSGIVRQHRPDNDAWREIRYMIFDLPNATGTFSERARQIAALTRQADIPWLQAVPQFRVDSTEELMRYFRDSVDQGAEGLMLHRADAYRVPGRSPDLLKLTPWLDAEARVLAHIAGKGRLAGMLGSIEVEDNEGRRFRIGTGFTDQERHSPPAVGAWVTYRYRELTPQGMPRFPVYHRIRELPWKNET